MQQVQYHSTADLTRMKELSQANPLANLHITDLPYRFSSWALDRVKNASLWIDDSGGLAAWAVLQTPFWTVDYAIRPGMEVQIHREVLAWTDEQARQVKNTPYGRPAWFVPVFADQAEQIDILEQAGFASQANVGEDSWSKVLLELGPGFPSRNTRLPDGFKIRPLAGIRELKAYVSLHREVFESTNMSIDWRYRVLMQPDYRPETDLVAVAPDGSLAAFCIGWINEKSPAGIMGQIEPMGVREAYRGLGIGKAILDETLARLRTLHAGRIFVETDNYRGPALSLYESAGFQASRDVLMFRKDY